MSDRTTTVVNFDRCEERKQRNRIKKKLLKDEVIATRAIVLEKGQWQLPVCGFLSNDNRLYGNIPYAFFEASESHSSFRARLRRAAQEINMQLTFGSVVGGQPQSSKCKPVMQFWERKPITSEYFIKRPVRNKCSVDDHFFNLKLTERLSVQPNATLWIKDRCIVSDNSKFDMKLRVLRRATAFCINRFEEKAKSICFGLMPYALTNSEFTDHYVNAFNLLGSRIGQVKHGFIIEINDKSPKRKKELFSSLTGQDDGRVKVTFYDFKSSISLQLSNYLQRKVNWKVNQWNGKRNNA